MSVCVYVQGRERERERERETQRAFDPCTYEPIWLSVWVTGHSGKAYERGIFVRRNPTITCLEEKLDDVLFFVVDILKASATFISSSPSASKLVEKLGVRPVKLELLVIRLALTQACISQCEFFVAKHLRYLVRSFYWQNTSVLRNLAEAGHREEGVQWSAGVDSFQCQQVRLSNAASPPALV